MYPCVVLTPTCIVLDKKGPLCLRHNLFTFSIRLLAPLPDDDDDDDDDD